MDTEPLRLDRVSVDDLSTRPRIREVALRMFAENGIRQTSLRAVAAGAGVSPSLVVHHFRSKQGLERAVHEEVISRMLAAVHGVGISEPIRSTLIMRRAAFEQLLGQQPYLSNYLFRVLSEGGDNSLEFVRDSVGIVRDEMDALVAAGLARPMADPDLGIILYWVLVNARYLLQPYLKELVGLDLNDPDDIKRLHGAEIDLLTIPLFPLPDDVDHG